VVWILMYLTDHVLCSQYKINHFVILRVTMVSMVLNGLQLYATIINYIYSRKNENKMRFKFLFYSTEHLL